MDMSANLSNLSNKQHAPVRRQQDNKVKPDADKGGRGSLSDGDIAEISHATTQAQAISDKAKPHDKDAQAKQERYEQKLIQKYDNAHNKIAESFSGFMAEIEGIGLTFEQRQAAQKAARDTAKKNVSAGMSRWAKAKVEHEIFA